jgi:L-alanine-DL-glutamate epimerase-like enolase superfamily enzyme
VIPGPSKALEVARDAHQRGLRVALHGWAGPVAQMQNVHIALAAGTCEMVEYCPLLHPLLVDGVAPSWKVTDGRLAASVQPGMGTAPIEELAGKYPFANVSSMIA